MNRKDLVAQWIEAAKSGTLLTAKHDPNNLGTTFSNDRSVLTLPMSASLVSFLEADRFEIDHYTNSRYSKTPNYFVVTPLPESGFEKVAELVPSGSTTPTGSYDRLIFVSGSKQGHHVFGDLDSTVRHASSSGGLTFVAKLE